MQNIQPLPNDGVQSMEAKSSPNGEPKEKLENLPGSEDKEFWAEADLHTGLVPHSTLSENGHYFVRVSGHQAECKNCHWGFELDPGDKIIDGHLYNDKGKLVI